MERHRFTTWQIAGAPPEAGVYVLWERDEPIYVGATRGDATIRSRLLAEFRLANSRLPRCNETGK